MKEKVLYTRISSQRVGLWRSDVELTDLNDRRIWTVDFKMLTRSGTTCDGE